MAGFEGAGYVTGYGTNADVNTRFVVSVLDDGMYVSKDKNIVPLKVAILAAFLFYRYKFLSRAQDKNLYRLP
ncbi:hypothetical protein [Paenibacillus sp. Y412MC10]|uniref:hypothetical protein n=1 Tax=Geobacillus sp. (strain Y412MC10) TaxID=481743 RepID=UPI0011A73E17|nr:hypothetical protein [Paenibacillus sp. Y412MC10]